MALLIFVFLLTGAAQRIVAAVETWRELPVCRPGQSAVARNSVEGNRPAGVELNTETELSVFGNTS